MPDSTAILLLAHGTPNVLSEMADYLAHVTAGRPMPQHVIEELQHRYAAIGLGDTPLPGGPPLTRWTLLQGQLLAERTGCKVYVAMRNWHPFIADVVAQMKTDGITHARVLCLAPQNSRTSTGLYRKTLEAALRDTPGAPFTYDFIAGWADEPLLAEAFAEKLLPTWLEANSHASAAAGESTNAAILFTAHSVPCRTILSSTALGAPGPDSRTRATTTAESAPKPTHPDGLQDYGPATAPDPYPIECKQTAARVAAQLVSYNLTKHDWFFAFQSQGIAGAPWLGPTVEDTLTALAQDGVKTVVLQPVGFLCDHVEILYDIDIAFRGFARNLGIELTRPPSLNDSPTLIRAIEHVITS